MINAMNISGRGLGLIRHFEGLHKLGEDGVVRPYRCQAGKLTIGWGCTKGVSPSDTMTLTGADARLTKELAIHEARVRKLVKVPLTQDQFDALVSFDFNTGGLTLEGGAPSGVLMRVNDRDYEAVCGQLTRWNKYTPPKTTQKLENPGLTRRRRAECALWRGIASEIPYTPPASRLPPTLLAAQPAPDMPQAVSEPETKSVIETKTALNGTLQTAMGVAGAVGGTVELAQKADQLGIAGMVILTGVIGASALAAYGGVWQIRDRARKLVLGV